ncbi:ATP-binding cassette domain-containing protein [Sphingobacteriaceae bacterium WQ 2009]|uniref:ATP-binding cassette domain-containing protein n=1 Tax=Rhinopithecimicrobium faecis TaxID=2820698 RepID=A0A8T4H5T9_9SPHI|nr:ATP-binding cassette domain-containing protein [Sphingobacteriaceae bacterium WQ 2009]
MKQAMVHSVNLNLKYGSNTVLKDLNWQIFPGQHWVIGGPSGTGKTSLAKALAGVNHFQGAISFHYQPENPHHLLYVSNWYQFTNLEGDRNFYYQQRYNKSQVKETLSVYAELQHYADTENLLFSDAEAHLKAFGFENFKEAQLFELSSGEHKKLQLIKALWLKPQLLIIDQPYTGLDAQSRSYLNTAFDQLAAQGTTLVLLASDQDLPSCIQHFAEIKDGKLVERASAQAFSKAPQRTKKSLPYFLQQAPLVASEIMVRMKDVSINYGAKQVLKNINWEVKAGEKWLLQGHNGSGKSTLLSLINADHPQAYANDITLFGNKRGSGESIWEIKAHLGIISPEMHWYFDPTAKVWQCIASGFFDSVGLFQNLGYERQQKVNQILDFFELTAYKDQLLNTLPLGKQRLALLARTIIKNPELLILDEPCQGLDLEQTTHFNAVVDELCGYGKTLIYVGHFETQLPSCIEKKLILENGAVIANETIFESVI